MPQFYNGITKSVLKTVWYGFTMALDPNRLKIISCNLPPLQDLYESTSRNGAVRKPSRSDHHIFQLVPNVKRRRTAKTNFQKKKTAFSHKPWPSLNLPIASPLKQNTTIQRDNRFDTHTVLYRVSQNWYHQHQAPKLMSKELIRQNQILLSDKRAKFCSYIL